MNLDPELTLSFSQEFVWYDSLMTVITLIVIVAALFVGTFVVLKIKKIPSRPYLALVLAGLLLFFGLPNFISLLESLPILVSQLCKYGIDILLQEIKMEYKWYLNLM